MNDRFKFRAWLIDEKRYGENINLFNCCNDTIYDVEEYDDKGSHYTMYGADEVILEQCTGLKDKNGKPIYEGDICIPAKDMADKAGEVYRAESGAYFIKGRMKSGMEYDFGIYWHHYMYEIIGNIHENADLLEAGEK